MSASVAIAQTTLALRDLLMAALRRDPGWTLTGGTSRVTTLPHGKPDQGSGERLNLALISVAPNMAARNAPVSALAYDLRYLVTAHVFEPLHSELLIGTALQAIADTPILRIAPPPRPSDMRLEAALFEAPGPAADMPVRLTVEAAPANAFAGVRVPALLVSAGPVSIAVQRPGSGLLR